MKDLKTLVLELASPDPAVRKSALVAIANTRIPQAYPHLVKASSDDPDPTVKALASKAVEGFRKLGLGDDDDDDGPIEPTVTMIVSPDGGVLDKVRAYLSDRDPAVRIKAALACVRLNNDGARRLLLQGFLKETDPAVKNRMVQGLVSSHDADTLDSVVLPIVKSGGKSLQAAALESIGSSGRSDLAFFALTFAADTDPIVKTRAKAAMKRIGQASCVAALVSMANSQVAENRLAAASALYQVPIREAVDLLRVLTQDPDESVRSAAVSTVEGLATNKNPQAMVLARELGMAGGPEQPEVDREILEGLASASSYERSAAARRIAAERPGGALNAVLERLGVEDEELVCIELLDAAGKIGNPDIIPAVRQYLGHMKISLRAKAVEALSRCACPEGFPLVALALHDPAPEVRGRAVVGIRPYGHIDIETYLREMLLTEDRQMQAEAISVIREIGDDELLGVLDQRSLRKDSHYLEIAAEALRSIEEKGSARASAVRNRLLGHLNEIGESTADTVSETGEPGEDGRKCAGTGSRPLVGSARLAGAGSVKGADDGDGDSGSRESSWRIGGVTTRPVAADQRPETPENDLGDLFAEYDPEEIAANAGIKQRADQIGEAASGTAQKPKPGPGRENRDGAGTEKKRKSSTPQLETMKLLKAYDKLQSSEKLAWMKTVSTTKGPAEFNALIAISETEIDDDLKGAAKSHVSEFDGLGFVDFGIRPAGAPGQGKTQKPEDSGPADGPTGEGVSGHPGKDTGAGETQGSGFISSGLNAPRLKPRVSTLNYEGRKSLATLQDDLKEREKMYNVRSYWDGSFPRSQVLLNSLREDTQEMVGRALPPGEKPQRACFCFCNREIRDFTSGFKSPDGPGAEKLMSLEAAATAIAEGTGPTGSPVDPAFPSLFAEVKKPKYLLLIQTRNFLVFFLRSHLSEKISSFFHVPLEGLSEFRLEFKDDKADAHLTLPGGQFTIPDLSVDDAYTMEESLKPRIEG